MKEKLKTLFLIIWLLVSLKIIILSGPYTLGVIVGMLVKLLHIPAKGVVYLSSFLAFTEKEYILGPILSQYEFLPMMRGFTDLLLMTLVINSWIFYFLYKKIKFNFKDRNSNLISFILVVIYLLFIKDAIEIFYFNEILLGIDQTIFYKVFFLICLSVLILNVISIFLICKNFLWSIIKRILFASILIFVSGYFLQLTIFALIWDGGALNFLFNNLDFLNDPTFKGPKTLNENISILYQSYGLNVAWCNPEYPCDVLRIQMQEACKVPNLFNKIPFGGKRLGTNLFFQGFQISLDEYEGCSKLRNMLDVCMEDHMRGEFARRWMEYHPPMAPKPYVGGSVIDTWSAHIRK
jgi:hypothetical protein